MSDYVYTSAVKSKAELSNALSRIYKSATPAIKYYSGSWGALALTRGHYCGFEPYENEVHLMVVIGGPILCFRNNAFLLDDNSNEGTKAIYERWMVEKKIDWSEDLSGPFTVFLINKSSGRLQVITDLMSFIPVYHCKERRGLYLCTHVDALARVAGEDGAYDRVSLADFMINSAVTYPYTAYEAIEQLPPSSKVRFSLSKTYYEVDRYWYPSEQNPYKSIEDAALALRAGVARYVNQVTENMTRVAQFISAGEDSRAISGILPERLHRDAYVFLDCMNREGKIAKRVARAYGARLHILLRSPTHYLEVLPEAVKLVGSGHQYLHAHSLGFDKSCNLSDYSAVFGGYLSDSLLKGTFSLKKTGLRRLPFIPDAVVPGEERTKSIYSAVIDEKVVEDVNIRRRRRFEIVKQERPISAHEWFALRPSTMRASSPNYYSTRRLFSSYEPFMCKEVVKISAAVPIEWKINRRLFHLAMKPYLKKSKWIFHSDGRLPYFGRLVNFPLQVWTWSFWQAVQKSGLVKGNQGPWADLESMVESQRWRETSKLMTSTVMGSVFKEGWNVERALTSDKLSTIQKLNLMQIVCEEQPHCPRLENSESKAAIQGEPH